MIEFTEKAKNAISKYGIRELYISIKYIQGPCSDNLCKMIPKIAVSTSKQDNSECFLIHDELVRVYAIEPILKTIKKHNDRPVISYSALTKKFTISGITYSF